MATLKFECKTFYQLSLDELYSVLKLRSEVFVIEQKCLFLDIDGMDQIAKHCLLKNENDQILAYTRIFDLNDSYEGYLSIGRVLNSPDFRKLGYGKKIMEYSISQCKSLYGNYRIKIGAQKYLLKFYSDLGFEHTGIEYLEDGIEHLYMILK